MHHYYAHKRSKLSAVVAPHLSLCSIQAPAACYSSLWAAASSPNIAPRDENGQELLARATDFDVAENPLRVYITAGTSVYVARQQ